MTNYLIDTSAWIEYFKGTREGLKAQGILEDNTKTCFHCRIILAELASKTIRDNGNANEILRTVRMLSKPIEEKEEDYIEAGKLHGEHYLKGKQFSLANAVITIVAGKNDCTIVTKDLHLKSAHAIFLK